jgi:hypothetical protein
MSLTVAIIALLVALLALGQANRAKAFWDQHQFRMHAYHELNEKYGITMDYFKRRRDKDGSRELDRDYRERIEKLLALDSEASAIRKKEAKP